ncbi:MAG: selenide, water dikinase SelD [Gemmatimonadota bacterium]|nr:selenide, water dikinase SelD [Gemmatimonadota bacterium]
MRGQTPVVARPPVSSHVPSFPVAPPIRLTEWANCAGCAAKMGPADLKQALAPLQRRDDPRLLVGHETFDDAGIFRISPEMALVQTVDFFAPIVDDPYDFGRVAATNALSDVFAMGGEPITAMNIVGFPTGKLPIEVLSDVLRGGQDAVHEAGAHIVGGHSITDEELKYGLSVTGIVHPDRVLTNAGAVPGDVFVLTKALGTGILATAAKRGLLPDAERIGLTKSMTTLNAAASRAALAAGTRCATDVTGFGLLGHASHIARASNITIRIHAAALPLLAGTRAMLERGALTGGAARNVSYLEPLVEWGSTTDEMRAILVDPQTSGGLFIALKPDRVDEFLRAMPDAVVVAEAFPRGARAIVVA